MEMIKERFCPCGNKLMKRQKAFCSYGCYAKSRLKISTEEKTCPCGTVLNGRQEKYCSTKCLHKYIHLPESKHPWRQRWSKKNEEADKPH